MNLLELFVKVGIDDKVTHGLDSIATSVRNKLGTAAKTAGLAMAAGTAAVAAFGVNAVQTGMNFDSSMSQVAATMGTTVDQIGELRDFAQEMGRTTMFSATQAADALNYMALAGYDAETSMGMLPNVLNLAAAGNMELATASDMVTDAQSAFGLSIEETQTMVDQMAKAAATGNTSVSQLGDAMLTVGATARTLSGGTGEAAQVLTLLADNGIKASEGGTALRNILMRLSAPTEKAKQQFEELGIQVFDAEGNMRPLQDIMLDIQDAMDGMSDSERTERLAKMFNKYDLAAVNALLGTNADRWNEVADSIANCEGFAEQMAETQMDNLQGDITYLKSAFEGLQIAISDNLTPTLREFVQGATDGIGQVTRIVESESFQNFAQKVGEGFRNAIDFISGFLDVLIPTTDETDAASGTFDKMAEALDQADMVAQDVSGVLHDLGDKLGFVKEQGDNLANSEAFKAGQSLAEVFREIAQAVNEFVTGFTETADFGRMADALGNLGIAIHDALDLPDDAESAGEAAGNIFNDLAAFIEVATPVIATFLAVLKNEFETMGNAVATVRDVIDTCATTFQTFQEIISPFTEFVSSTFGPAFDDMNVKSTALGGAFGVMGSDFEGVTTIVNNALEGIRVSFQVCSDVILGFVTFVMGVPGSIAAAIEQAGAFFAGLRETVSGAVESMRQAVSQKIEEIQQFFIDLPGNIMAALGNLGTDMWNMGRDIVQGLIDGIWANIGSVGDTLIGGLQGAVDSAKSFLGIASPSKLFEWIGEMSMEGLGKGYDRYMPDLPSMMADMTAPLTSGNGLAYASAAVQAAPSIAIYIDGARVNDDARINQLFRDFMYELTRNGGM